MAVLSTLRRAHQDIVQKTQLPPTRATFADVAEDSLDESWQPSQISDYKERPPIFRWLENGELDVNHTPVSILTAARGAGTGRVDVPTFDQAELWQRGGDVEGTSQSGSGLPPILEMGARQANVSRGVMRLPCVADGFHFCDLLVDGVRALHILNAYTFASLVVRARDTWLMFLTRGDPKPPPQVRKALESALGQLRELDFDSLPALDLAAETPRIAATAHYYHQLYLSFHRASMATAPARLLAAEIFNRRLSEVVEESQVMADDYLNRRGLGIYSYAQWVIVKALVLREVDDCSSVSEDFLAANSALFAQLTHVQVRQDWRIGEGPSPTAGAARSTTAASARPGLRLSRREQGGDTASARACSRAFFNCYNAFQTLPESIELDHHLQVMDVPAFEPDGGSAQLASVDKATSVCPTGKALPGRVVAGVDQLTDRLQQLPRLSSGLEGGHDLLGRVRDLRSQAASLHDAITCDGELWSQAVALVQRQATLATMAQLYRALEDEVAQRWSSALTAEVSVAEAPRPLAVPPPTSKRAIDAPPSLPPLPLPVPVPVPVPTSTTRAPVGGRADIGSLSWGAFLDRWCDPGRRLAGGESLRVARERLLMYHVDKHGAPGASPRAYVEEAMEVYRQRWVGEVRRRAASSNEYVRLVRDADYYGVYSWQGQLITFCNRRRCGEKHYPSLYA